ncbi:MAG TPA: tetratricopeptide repeat protein [Pyrinomonadaceae bacterium]|jgi:tetratricopeptide (TPR) repeat protein
MRRANIEQPSRPRERAAALACAALALFFGVAAHAAPQQTPKPNIAGEVEDKKSAPAEADPRQPAAPGRGKGQPKPPKPAPSYEVTFKTDVPDAEIFIVAGSSANPSSAQSLGRTDAGGKLTKRLPRGTYNLLASRPGYRIQRQRVEVRSGGANDVSFSLAMPVVARKEDEEEKAAPEPTPTPAETAEPAPADPLADADALIKRFLDVKETEGVKAEDWKSTREQLNAALEKDPSNSQLKARLLAADGQLAYLAGDFANALVAFKQAALAQPDFALAHYGLGNAYLATNQPAEAFKAYTQAVNLNSELALAYRGMGDALAKQNKPKDAAAFYARAKSFGQQLPVDTGLAAARDLKRRKRWAQALKEFQDVAATKPSAEVYVEIGDCYVGLEQPLSASQSYRKATELDPRSALAHYRFGEVMQKLREYAASMEAFERALALDPQGTVINRKRAREMADDAADKLKKMK